MPFFEEEDYYTGQPLAASAVSNAERILGYSLPRSYVALLEERNGGVPLRRCFYTPFPTSWSPDHFEISAILGLGGKWGIDSQSGLGSSDMIREWGYPPIGIVICDTPSAGHDTVMLDYRHCGNHGEPEVAYIDEDRVPRKIADSFEEFLARLEECREIEDED